MQLQCARVLHETLLVPVPVLVPGSDTMLWKEKERYRVRVVQMDNFKVLLGIRRMDRVPNTRIREWFGVMKGVDKRIHEGVLWWIGWRMIGLLGECGGSC